MDNNEEQKISELLRQARTAVPQHNEEAVFRHILDALDHSDAVRTTSFRQLRNTGISLLLLLAVNIGVWSFAGKRQVREQHPATQETFLQSYDLNIYQQ